MKTVSVFLPALFAVVWCCAPAPHEKNDGDTATIQAENQRLWLAPIVNNSRIEDLLGWPRDSLQKALLRQRFNAVGERLLSEFRRCEKYGLFTMVDDSAGATIRISVKLAGYNRSGDSLSIPVTVHIDFPSKTKIYDFTYSTATGGVTVSPGNNEFHYAADLTAGLITAFPFRQIVYRFYSAPQ